MRTGLYSGFSLLSGWIGVQALVMYTIVFEAVMAIVAMTVAVASTGAARTGMAYAGGDHAAIHRALNASILTLFVLLAPMMALFLFFPEWIVMLFLGFGSSEARALTSLVSPILISAAFFLLAEGMRVVISQALNSLSDMKTPSLIAVLMYWGVAFPLGALLGFVVEFGVLGFWIGLALGMATIAVAYIVRFQRLVGTQSVAQRF
uniref:Multidrug resistance protein, MATE family n=1 Tax=Candidatus Kentrum sp. TC TaxID=2126339 RepID=A0A450YLF8_9GAMM|nr:MAG: multidrug resistance protein, MATE family [Candidatus Kentron sp. TC]